MYEFQSRVRYSEINSKGLLRFSSLVNYLQDCSTFQSEDLGLGVEYLRSLNQVWVLNYWQIDLYDLPKLTDYITIGTIPYEIKGFFGFRNFYIKDAKTDAYLVKANSVWTLLDIEHQRPIKVTEKMREKFGVGQRLDMEYTDRKITLTGDAVRKDPVVITPSMLDTNNHVNNEQYIELALTYVPEGLFLKRIRTEYKKQTYLGETLFPEVYENEQSIGVAFYKEGDAEPCVRCQFLY